MTGPSAQGLHTDRRSRRGLMIEGTVVARSGGEPVRRTREEALAGLDLSARADGRAYQSLLDDAIRLARRCRSIGADRWGTAASS